MSVKIKDSGVCLGCQKIPYFKANCLRVRQCNMSHVEGFDENREPITTQIVELDYVKK